MVVNKATRKRLVDVYYKDTNKEQKTNHTSFLNVFKRIDTMCVIVGLLLFILFWYSVIQLFNVNVEDYTEVTLEPGDTLWGIAEQYGHNPIRFAQWVEENNNVDAFNLKAGQTVYIPVKEGD